MYKKIAVVLVSCLAFLYGHSQRELSAEQKFLNRQIHVMLGPVFYKHLGFEISGAYFHPNKNWVFMVRSWGSGWETDEYPGPDTVSSGLLTRTTILN